MAFDPSMLGYYTGTEHHYRLKRDNLPTLTGEIWTDHQDKAKRIKKMARKKDKIDVEVIINLAVCTAFLRLDFNAQTMPLEVEEQDAWDDIADETMKCLRDVGIDTSEIKLDKQAIALAFWSMDADELEEFLETD